MTSSEPAQDPRAPFLVAALYQFVSLPDFETLRGHLLERGQHHQLVGSLLLAEEGINGTIAGVANCVTAFLDELRTDPRFERLDCKFSRCEEHPFRRWKVRLKSEIVSLGVDGVDPKQMVGTYVPPDQWNTLIQQDDVVVIDTRNHYETAIGKFKGAVDPDTETFREFPQWAAGNLPTDPHQKIAMYCTGGIRCEKATSYLLGKGYQKIFHLEGGILRYLEEIPPEQSLWQGDCFVFDDRIALSHQLTPGPYELCEACQMPIRNGAPHQCERVKRAKWLEEMNEPS